MIEVIPSSSSGGTFTSNSNSILLKVFETYRDQVKITYKQLQEELKKTGESPGNMRTIFPLSQYCKFCEYQNDEFKFLPLGSAYVRTLHLQKMLNKSEYCEEIKDKTKTKLEHIRQDLVYEGVLNLLQTEASYKISLEAIIWYLLTYNQIDKQEFCYLLAQWSKEDRTAKKRNYRDKIDRSIIDKYRSGQLNFEIHVITTAGIRDDMPAFSYLINLLKESRLVKEKSSGRYEMENEAKDKLKKLLEVSENA